MINDEQWFLCTIFSPCAQRASVIKMSEDEINDLLQSKGFAKRVATEEPDEETEHSDLLCRGAEPRHTVSVRHAYLVTR